MCPVEAIIRFSFLSTRRLLPEGATGRLTKLRHDGLSWYFSSTIQSAIAFPISSGIPPIDPLFHFVQANSLPKVRSGAHRTIALGRSGLPAAPSPTSIVLHHFTSNDFSVLFFPTSAGRSSAAISYWGQQRVPDGSDHPWMIAPLQQARG
jgi:hypothetical protein